MVLNKTDDETKRSVYFIDIDSDDGGLTPPPYNSLVTTNHAESEIPENNHYHLQLSKDSLQKLRRNSRPAAYSWEEPEEPACAPACIGYFDLIQHSIILLYHLTFLAYGGLVVGIAGVVLNSFGIYASWKLIQSRDIDKPKEERRKNAEYWKCFSIFILVVQIIFLLLIFFLAWSIRESSSLPEILYALIVALIVSIFIRVCFLHFISSFINRL